MPVSKQSVFQFLNRQLEDFEWVKQLTHSQIDEALEGLYDKQLTKNLWLHQKATLLLLSYQKRFIPFIDMGGGKTVCVLTIIRQRKMDNQNPRAIIFVPYLTATQTWVDETLKHAPELKCCALVGSGEENRKALKDKTIDLFVICYQSAVAMVTETVTVKGKRKWQLSHRLMEECLSDFDMLVMDELQKTKSSSSLTFKLCLFISERVEYVYGLTGTPFGKDMTDLWSQFFLIDFGETLGFTISFYHHVFFSKKFKFFGGVEFKFKKKMFSKLQSIIRNRSIRYSESEFSDIKQPIRVIRKFKLPIGIKSYVDKAKKELRQAVDTGNYELAGNSFIQLNQLSSGYLTFKDDVERVQIDFEENPKLEALCSLIDEMPGESKLVVFHNFIHTNELISKQLKKLGIGHARIWGGQKDKIGELKRFKEDKNCRVMILNSRSGSSSLNLQFANYVVFMEQPSALDRQQAEKRVHRSGQTKHVFIYDFFVEGTYDEKTHKDNKLGKNTLKQLLDGKTEV